MPNGQENRLEGRQEEVPGQERHRIGRFVECEMTCIENMNLSRRHVAPVGLGFIDLKRRVIATPEHEERRLMAVQPRLPCRIARDVGPVVIEQIHLDVALARTAQEGELIGPEVRVVEGYVGARSEMPLAGGVEGQKVRT
jgi:hypothetical protein